MIARVQKKGNTNEYTVPYYDNIYHIVGTNDECILLPFDVIPMCGGTRIHFTRPTCQTWTNSTNRNNFVVLETHITKGHFICLEGVEFIELYCIYVGTVLQGEESLAYIHAFTNGATHSSLRYLLHTDAIISNRHGDTSTLNCSFRLIYRIPLSSYRPLSADMEPPIGPGNFREEFVKSASIISVPCWLWDCGMKGDYTLEDIRRVLSVRAQNS